MHPWFVYPNLLFGFLSLVNLNSVYRKCQYLFFDFLSLGVRFMYEKFQELLDKYGKTAAQVSKETGVASSTLSEWKKGKYTPKLDKLQKIADFFNVPIDYFSATETKISTNDHPERPKDLAKFLENTEVMFDGEVHYLDEEDKQKLKNALEFVFWQAKEKNKRKPKK
uniref:Repressor protein CI n=1 Tax=Myoviridae sp. ct9dX1 TaxID=2827665 RepID=A0A8S5TIC2_9CAUD|nr:MAG TPA: Repressor protein CI [Myoviridae sp. ct9dX1]